MAKKIFVTQLKSEISCKPLQRKTLHALGLRKINSKREHEDNQVIRGMIEKVKHLVSVSEK